MKEQEKENWKLIGYSHQIADSGDFCGYYEITNGKISILTKNDDDEALQLIVDTLNDSRCKFYQDTEDKVKELKKSRSKILSQRNDWEFKHGVLKNKVKELEATINALDVKNGELKADLHIAVELNKALKGKLEVAEKLLKECKKSFDFQGLRCESINVFLEELNNKK